MILVKTSKTHYNVHEKPNGKIIAMVDNVTGNDKKQCYIITHNNYMSCACGSLFEVIVHLEINS